MGVLMSATRVLAIAVGASLWLPPSLAAEPWAAISGYYPGMSKLQAKALGLQNCAPKSYSSDIVCNPTKPLRIGSIESTSAEIVLDSKSGRATFIVVHFPESAGKPLLSEMQRVFGAERGLHSPAGCASGEWDRNDDYKMEINICLLTSRYVKTTGAHVSVRHLPGRRAALQRAAKAEQSRQEHLRSFNSK